jgi:hypothetical protein
VFNGELVCSPRFLLWLRERHAYARPEKQLDRPMRPIASIQQNGEWKMKSLKYSLVGASLLLAMNSAIQAQVMVDMAKFTCAQLLSGDPDAVEAAVWLSGYYNGQRKNTVLDMNILKHNSEVVIAACKNNPDKTMMQTVESLLSAK